MNIQNLCGWINNPAAVEKIMGTMLLPEFKTAGQQLKNTGVNKNVWFWFFEDLVFGYQVGTGN